MSTERWKRRSSFGLGAITPPPPSPSPSYYHETDSKGQHDVGGEKKPRGLSKALRSMSNSSLDSLSAPLIRNSGSVRRLQKTQSSSGSMLERLQKRYSRDSVPSSPTIDRPASPMSQLEAYTSMKIVRAGPLKVDVSLLKAKTEYLVLSDQCIIKFGNIESARNVFPSLNQVDTSSSRGSTGTPSVSNKPPSMDIRLEVPLRSVVAVFADDGSATRPGIEIWWFSPRPKLAYCNAHLYFSLGEERDAWLQWIQRTYKSTSRKDISSQVLPDNLNTRINHLVRSTEPMINGCSENLIFPVARRGLNTMHRASVAEESQDHIDVSSFYLVTGPCMCYFIEVLKADHSTAASDLRLKVLSFGTVTLTRFRASVASHEQRFIVSFRLPFGRETRLDLASTHYRRIIETLTKVDRILKPMWPQKFQQAIFDIKGLPPPLQLTSGNDLGGVERSLQAYCVAFHVDTPEWKVEWNTVSRPTFRLLPLDGAVYTPLQLLAVFRALRYNSFFKSICLRDVDMTSLIGRSDYSQYGDSVVHTSLNGARLSEDDYDLLLQAPVLEQEIHTLMFASSSIRNVDLTNVLGVRNITKRHSRMHSDFTDLRMKSSEILRPMLMLFRRQLSYCHSVSLADNPLADSDVDELANLLVLDHVHLSKLDLSHCAIREAGLSKLWIGLAAQSDSLQHIDTSNNQGTVSCDIIQGTLSVLRAIKVLKIAGNTRMDSDFSLFDERTIKRWALQELDLSAIMLNDPTIDVLCNYLAAIESQQLHTIHLNNCNLTGWQIARLFRAMGQGRQLSIYINGSRLDEGIDDLCAAVACGFAPKGVFLQMIEFNYESSYTQLLRALTANKTIECLSLAGSATPDAASDTMCKVISAFFAENDTVRFLDISGFDSKLDEGRLGREFSKSLAGLRGNRCVEHLRVRNQMLNINVGDLAEAISGNTSIQTVDCENNNFNLSNFRHLISHLETNSTIRYFSAFSEHELARTIKKSLDVAVPTIPVRRASVMSLLRPERGQVATSKPLGQELQDAWNTAVEALDRIMERNRNTLDTREEYDHGPLSSRRNGLSNQDSIFSTAFGSLALQDYESRKTRAAQALSVHLNDIHVDESRLSLGGLASPDMESAKPKRPDSTVSSEIALSPVTDGASSRSGGESTPPEESEQAFAAELQLGDSYQGEPFYDAAEGNYTYGDVQDLDGGLQMKRFRRFLNETVSRIEEEAG